MVEKYDQETLCGKIKNIYPEIGTCGLNVYVDYDDYKDAWLVAVHRGDQYFSTHLEWSDADNCMEGRQCLSLGVQISQLVESLRKVE